MKLRIRGNALRLRLSQSEVRAIAEERPVDNVVNFGAGHRFAYVLEASREVDTMRASFEGSSASATITVRLPTEQARAWAESDAVSLEGKMPVEGGDEDMSILVEKDFACLKPRGEDETDMYPHPSKGSVVC